MLHAQHVRAQTIFILAAELPLYELVAGRTWQIHDSVFCKDYACAHARELGNVRIAKTQVTARRFTPESYCRCSFCDHGPLARDVQEATCTGKVLQKAPGMKRDRRSQFET
jgi:hypothetical protein